MNEVFTLLCFAIIIQLPLRLAWMKYWMSLKKYSMAGESTHLTLHTHIPYTTHIFHTHHASYSDGIDMDLDGDKGRQLLRILIQMVMVSHPSLASNALNLLIRHFSQRKEMVQGFRQVYMGIDGEELLIDLIMCAMCGCVLVL